MSKLHLNSSSDPESLPGNEADVQVMDNRRYVRVEITSPASLGRIKDIFGNYWPDGEEYPIQASVLNISDGGILLDLDQPVNEGDVVAMRFVLKDVRPMEGVLGLVKRCDHDVDGNLTGVEFVNRDNLADKLSDSELELLSEEFRPFDQYIREVVSEVIKQERI